MSVLMAKSDLVDLITLEVNRDDMTFVDGIGGTGGDVPVEEQEISELADLNGSAGILDLKLLGTIDGHDINGLFDRYLLIRVKLPHLELRAGVVYSDLDDSAY